MNRLILKRRIYLLILMAFPLAGLSQGVLTGTVRDASGTLPYVNVGVAETSLGAVTDAGGHFELRGIPDGVHQVVFTFVGYKQVIETFKVSGKDSLHVDIFMSAAFNELEEVVVTGTRTQKKLIESPVAVNVLDAKALRATQSQSLADGLNYQPGLRMETNCQTCGYSQLRMNGLGGAYSQILINGRPIFNALVGLYGLEQIPTNTIEQVEVVRGGGSAVYGSNAIAGTVNVITREPDSDYVDVHYQYGLINGAAADHAIKGNASKVWSKGGMSIYGSYRNRQSYDHNGDDYSELPRINGKVMGAKGFYKPGKYSRLRLEVTGIHEQRRGGNKLEAPPHEADQAEDRLHKIFTGSLNFNTPLPSKSTSFNLYVAGQRTYRDHYTGVDGALAYGDTWSGTLNTGFQFIHFLRAHEITYGLDYLADDIFDEIPLYDYLVDQTTHQVGFFIQDEWAIIQKLKILGGLRMDKHNLIDQPIFNPRINLMYSPGAFTQVRATYSTGFRAPQAFDADLHIAFAGGGVAITSLDDALQEERSRSLSASINYDKPSEEMIFGFTLEGFYTRLYDAFVLEEQGDDASGNTIIKKINGGNSTVQGITLETRLNFSQRIEWDMGFTLQQSRFDDPVFWSSESEGTTAFLRTPNDYGYFTLTGRPRSNISITMNGVYTGAMIVPRFAGSAGVPEDQLKTTPRFFETGISLTYGIPIRTLNSEVEISGDVQNLFNAYQDDFDIGRYRDSNYVYGPARPRTYILSIRFRTLGYRLDNERASPAIPGCI